MRLSLHRTLWLLLLGTLSAGSQVWAHDTLPDGPFLSTTGRAALRVSPDQATLDISVNAQAPTALKAKQQLDERVNHYLAFLRTEGLALSDIEAASLVTWPRYRVDNTGEQHLDGYGARRTLRVTVRQLDRLSALLDAALRDRLDGIRSITYDVAQPQRWREQVRDQALDNAHAQAQALAKRAGATLGPVYSIRYTPPATPSPLPPPLLLGMRPGNPVPPAPPDNAAGYPARALTFSDHRLR